MFGPQAHAFLKELGRHLRDVSGAQLSYTYLLQRISVAIQRGNAVVVMGSMKLDHTPPYASIGEGNWVIQLGCMHGYRIYLSL